MQRPSALALIAIVDALRFGRGTRSDAVSVARVLQHFLRLRLARLDARGAASRCSEGEGKHRREEPAPHGRTSCQVSVVGGRPILRPPKDGEGCIEASIPAAASHKGAVTGCVGGGRA